METKLEGIAAKARKETNLQFTSLLHHVTKELIWENLNKIPKDSATGVDGVDVEEAKKDFKTWSEKMLTEIHRQSYRPPEVKRVWIPKPGKAEKRPIGIPSVTDRALQKSVTTVLAAIYEQDFLNSSFGGRPGRGQQNALATFDTILMRKKVNWVLEADLKNFFGSLDHGWLLKFVGHRVGDPRILTIIKRWLKAGVMEDGKVEESEIGTPQGGAISVLLSNIYLHYVLDLWFEKAIKPKLKGESYLIRYIDDFIVCFQYHNDAVQFQQELSKRIEKFSLKLEPNKTKLVEFGRFAKTDAEKRGEKPGTIYFLGFTHFCTTNLKGKFKVGRKTEKSRLKRGISKLKIKIGINRHKPIKEQVDEINQVLRGHYNYFGMSGNYHSLQKVYIFTKKCWRKMLSSRSRKGKVTWEKFDKLNELFPLMRPRLSIKYSEIGKYAML